MTCSRQVVPIYQIGQRSGQQNPFDKLETAGRGRLDTQHGRVLWFIAVQRIWASRKTRQTRGRGREPEDGEAARRHVGFRGSTTARPLRGLTTAMSARHAGVRRSFADLVQQDRAPFRSNMRTKAPRGRWSNGLTQVLEAAGRRPNSTHHPAPGHITPAPIPTCEAGCSGSRERRCRGRRSP
jgi:hypothetical protein